jgi:hypothetical protein
MNVPVLHPAYRNRKKAEPFDFMAYALSQIQIYDPNGLELNTTNDFGMVDSNGKISGLYSISTASVQANDLVISGVTLQPDLQNNVFGAKKGMYFAGNQLMLKRSPSFTPDFNDKFFICGQFKVTGNVWGKTILSVGNFNQSVPGFLISFDADGNIISLLKTHNNATIVHRSAQALNDNNTHNFIFQWSGGVTADKMKLYIDGSEMNITSTTSGSFVGSSFYDRDEDIFLRLGSRQNSNNKMIGHIGKIGLGLGTPIVSAIFNYLNS